MDWDYYPKSLNPNLVSQALTFPVVTIMISQGSTLLNKTQVNKIKRKITNEQEVHISEQALKVKQDQTSHTLKAI